MSAKNKTKSTTAQPRLSVVIAREARIAIVFRRGPSKQVRMIIWDLATDTFVKGQWLAGRVRNCDVSPDGKLVVYFASKHGTEFDTFTAICRPPNFTALALWPDGMSWGGGGRFVSNKKVVLGYNCNPKELNDGKTIPEDFEVSDGAHEKKLGNPAASPWVCISSGSLEKYHETDSMRVYDEPWVEERSNPCDDRRVLERRLIGSSEINGRRWVEQYRVFKFTKSDDRNPKIEDLGDPDWADWDHDGSLLLSRNGCLFRRHGPPFHKNQELIQVADFRDDVFKRILPTKDARLWP